ncbi:MAG: hypothetical protein EHM45_23090 [Desulfobacteraceae bacterium]|nr:MAG: hypothetical protein EHM45_23090 [Desulfobacteraceae bacterium]
MNAGLVGGIIGGVIGLAGGAVGTYFSIKNTNGPRERAFMIKTSIITWVAIILFLGLMFLLPNPYRYLLWIPYGILLPLGIVYGNRVQQRIRKEESQRNGGRMTQ